MVLRLEPAYPNIGGSVQYNENKANGVAASNEPEEETQEELGHVVETRNVPDGSELLLEFERLRILNKKKQKRGRKLENEAFHMSINPGENDLEMSDAQMAKFVNEVMTKLGYGDQPYRLYWHNDIDRKHYHVVTTRIGQDGKKINDSFEEARINKIMHELSKKYGYTVGLGVGDNQQKRSTDSAETKQASTKEPDKGKTNLKFPPYSRNSDVPIAEQFKRIHKAAVQWSFTTREQYQAILMRRFNVRSEFHDNHTCFQGYQNRITEKAPCIFDDELGFDALVEIDAVIDKTKMSQKKSQRERVERVSKWAMENSDNFIQFRQKMEQKGIYTVVSWTADGKPFGLTWLDMATHCAWKGSETKADLNWLNEQAAEKGWEITMDSNFEKRGKDTEKKKRKVVDVPKNKPTVSRIHKKDSAAKRSEKEAQKEEASAPSVFGHGGDQEAHNTLGGGSDEIYEDETKKIMSGKVM